MGKRRKARIFKGVSVADGVAMGQARVVDVAHFPSHAPAHEVPEHDLPREVDRLRDACARARTELEELCKNVEEKVGRREADLIRPQVLMVEDPAFLAEVEELIIENRINTEAAVAQVMDRFERLIESVEDPYLRERSTDVRDAGRRVLAKLLFIEGDPIPRLIAPSVVVASHLVPSLTVHLEREKILALATERGGYTSHGAILARSLGIPAVTGLDGLTDHVTDGETVIVDGMAGQVIVAPSKSRVTQYVKTSERYAADRCDLLAHVKEPARTRDGESVAVLANVGRTQEVEAARELGADGVGLYRTEFDYLSMPSLPSEDMLAEQYGSAAEAFGQKGVALRVLDIGGDKFPPSIPLAREENPFIGMRGLRLLLERAEDLLLPQLRAILRASARGKVSVMYPMVADVDDLRAAQEHLERARREVLAAGHFVSDQVAQGIMIEVPSCVPMLPEMLAAVDYATVGTNDLVQYLLAADRNSERMVAAYDPFHPAVVRVLREICAAAREKGVDISVCGEAASDPSFLPLLLGLGYRRVSVNVGALPHVKQAVRDLSVRACEQAAAEALRSDSADKVRAALGEMAQE